jgi:uncharacterized repeat protein (TIGR03847 family)
MRVGARQPVDTGCDRSLRRRATGSRQGIESLEFGPRSDLEAQRLRVEAIGEPGQRRFRLLALLGGETFIVWMEKQQLQALGLALEQMLEQLPDAGPELGAAGAPLDFDLSTRRQFRAGRMELGYDESVDKLVIVAHDINDEPETAEPPIEDVPASFACRITREQAREMSADAAAVVAAGRPRCTMCGAPMGPDHHVCPQQNGHYPTALADADDALEED